MKKLKVFLSIILLIIFVATFSSAASTADFSVVSKPTAKITYGTKSYLERSVVSTDLKKREITLQLKAVNEEEGTKPSGEIMLVIDNSRSMLDEVSSGKTREDLVIDSAKTLITNILSGNEDLKIGAVSFSTNTDTTKEGTIEDAQLVSNLTNDVDSLISAVSNIEYNGPRTDLDAGITLAKDYFTNSTDDSHKYIIVLTDGVPNVALSYDGYYYSDDCIEKTKASLESLSSVTDNVIVMLSGISNGSSNATRLKEGEDTMTYDQIIEEIFGTTTNPTIGKFYYVTDNEIETTIKNDIYNDLVPTAYTFTDLKISDFFTQEIVDNFTFSYVMDPTHGTISKKIDTSTNSITWNIPELKSGETALVQYKLKLKDGYSEDILGKVLDTNKNLTIEYTDSTGNTNTKSSDKTPQVLIDELPIEYPKTGKTTLLVTIALVIISIGVFGIRYFKIRK